MIEQKGAIELNAEALSRLRNSSFSVMASKHLEVAAPYEPAFDLESVADSDSDSGVDLFADDDGKSSFSDRSKTHSVSPSRLTEVESETRFAVLSYEQVKRLNDVLTEPMAVYGRGNFPILDIKLCDLIRVVRSKLEADSVTVRDVRLNGGAASHVLASETALPYNDTDLIFNVELSSGRAYDRVKFATLSALLDFLPEGVSKNRMSTCSIKEAYVSKMIKVTEGDRWSLISLGSKSQGKNVELKFVDTMKRQFEFSVDSFQIVLDSFLVFQECAHMPISESFYPTVIGDSVYGDIREALLHLHKRLIATRAPEEIRGGGLLKYCNLLVQDYRPASPKELKQMERYMCSRFFIDFSDIMQQKNKLETYLWNHFRGSDPALVYDYLMILYTVVDESTVCLMGHERRQTLSLIEELGYSIYYGDLNRVFVPQPCVPPQAYYYPQSYYYPAIPSLAPAKAQKEVESQDPTSCSCQCHNSCKTQQCS
ncbi:terminal nucleotidyltransferase 5C-like isoform X2 [Artemia franciscana]|uniref:terminal nucleotidyltransferase 5C-like isoform X2 n=1 Tax=Artemia franciscana TaxID=6661 RepID=UPI0032DA39C7